MCLITICPRGSSKDIKSLENAIKNGLECNGDGAGVAIKFASENLLHFKKGFTTFDQIKEYLEEKKPKKEDAVMFHYRIGTQGAKNKYNAHPFVVSQDPEDLCQTEGVTDKPLLMHNGIFSGHFSGPNSSSYFSDTYYFTNWFFAIPEVLGMFKRDLAMFKKVFYSNIGSNKIAVLFPDNPYVFSTGDYIKDGDYYHSNSGYCRRDYSNVGGVETYGEAASSRVPIKYVLPIRSKEVTNRDYAFGTQSFPINESTFSHITLCPNPHTSRYLPTSIEEGKVYDVVMYTKDGNRVTLQKRQESTLISMENKDDVLQRCCTIRADLNDKKYEVYNDVLWLYERFVPTKANINRLQRSLANSADNKFIHVNAVSLLTEAALIYSSHFIELFTDYPIASILADPSKWIKNLEDKFPPTKKVIETHSHLKAVYD